MIILITGISSGFGLAMARQLAAEGHTVYGTVRRDVEQLPDVHYLRADVRDTASVKAAVDAVLSAEGRIDVLVNNAGMGIGGPVEFAPEDDVKLQMDTNFMGQVRFAQAVLPAMRRQGGGKILCFSSIGGVMGLPFQGFYSASKFAIEGFCEALQIEVRRHGIQVILIEPGDFSTGFTDARLRRFDGDDIYRGRIARSVSTMAADERGGCSPEKVGKALSRAALSRKCPVLITVGAPYKCVWALMRLLPSSAANRILGMLYAR